MPRLVPPREFRLSTRGWMHVALGVGSLVVLLLSQRSFDNRSGRFRDGVGKQATLIVVPGAGQTPGGTVNAWTELRLARALELWEASDKLATIATLSRGTVHKPNPRDADGFDVTECATNARWLLKRGVPPHLLVEESLSLDTIGNAVYLRALLAPGGDASWARIVVVSNAWHMERTTAIFEHVLSIPAKPRGPRPQWSVAFDTVPDGMEGAALEGRAAREAASLVAWKRGTQLLLPTLEAALRWLSLHHAAYATSRLNHRRVDVPGAGALATYQRRRRRGSPGRLVSENGVTPPASP